MYEAQDVGKLYKRKKLKEDQKDGMKLINDASKISPVEARPTIRPRNCGLRVVIDESLLHLGQTVLIDLGNEKDTFM